MKDKDGGSKNRKVRGQGRVGRRTATSKTEKEGDNTHKRTAETKKK